MSPKLHLIIFGATGVTGKYAVLELFNLAQEFNLYWGVAGRNKEKLEQVLKWVAKKVDNPEVLQVPIIIADVADQESLNVMALKTEVLVNCCGPYRHYGEPVVKACVENGTDYVDVAGEPFFMEKIQLDYHKAAEDKKVHIVSACGFDSIPADLGTEYMRTLFTGDINSVEEYLSSKCTLPKRPSGAGVHYGTYESAIYGVGFANDLGPLRRKLYTKKLPKLSPFLKARSMLHKNDQGKWCIPFPGADRSVVNRSQRFFYFQNHLRPIYMHAYYQFDSLFAALKTIVAGALFTFLAKFQFGRSLLLKHPKLFSLGTVSHDDPPEELLSSTEFKMRFIAEGWDEKSPNIEEDHVTPPNRRIEAQLSAMNPAYGFTVKALLLSAITILKEKSNLPNKGGVYTPGAAFKNTSLWDQLKNHGMKFEVLSNIQLQSKL